MNCPWAPEVQSLKVPAQASVIEVSVTRSLQDSDSPGHCHFFDTVVAWLCEPLFFQRHN